MRSVGLILITCVSLYGQTITIADHNKGSAGTPTGTATTGAMNCSTANKIILFVGDVSTDPTTATISNSSGGGGWAVDAGPITSPSNAAWNVGVWSKTGTFSSTETVSASNAAGGFTAIFAVCITNGGIVDQSAGAQYSATGTFQAGAITPTQANEIVLSFVACLATSGNWSVSGTTQLDIITSLSDGATVQTTATTYNPTWNAGAFSGVGNGSGINVSYKVLAATANTTPAHGTIL